MILRELAICKLYISFDVLSNILYTVYLGFSHCTWRILFLYRDLVEESAKQFSTALHAAHKNPKLANGLHTKFHNAHNPASFSHQVKYPVCILNFHLRLRISILPTLNLPFSNETSVPTECITNRGEVGLGTVITLA
jgi:hypothetical protein